MDVIYTNNSDDFPDQKLQKIISSDIDIREGTGADNSNCHELISPFLLGCLVRFVRSKPKLSYNNNINTQNIDLCQEKLSMMSRQKKKTRYKNK